MSLTITLGAGTYFPLRAVPMITSGLLNTPTLADMISNPDGYCDAYHDASVELITVPALLPIFWHGWFTCRSESAKP